MENPPLVFTSNNRDWCAIYSTFVISCALCIVGFIFLAYRDVVTGLVLLFISGSILTLTVCAALGKYQSFNKQPEDRPPSYRISWRRSFMRHNRTQKETEETLQPGIVPLQTFNLNQDMPDNPSELRLSASSLQMDNRTASRFEADTRHTRSFDNIINPPSYEDILTAMDETTRQKLKSELCLPSLSHF